MQGAEGSEYAYCGNFLIPILQIGIGQHENCIGEVCGADEI
jgi:hypothetical protein